MIKKSGLMRVKILLREYGKMMRLKESNTNLLKNDVNNIFKWIFLKKIKDFS